MFKYNYILIVAIIAWISAQIIKNTIYIIKNKKFNKERLIGAGGMPSSHSALVISSLVATLRSKGGGSFEFAIMFILAGVVIYDALNVRWQAGLHAKELNKISNLMKQQGVYPTVEIEEIKQKKKKELKEYLGHTPLEVLCGSILGAVCAFIVPIG